MSITEHLEGLSIAVAQTRKRIGEINLRLDDLNGETYRLQNASPHTDDIIAAKRAELQAACLRFQSRTAEQSKSGPLSLTPCLNDPDAQAYYLRAQISAQIPDEVDRLYPEAKSGMKQQDRKKALAEVDKEKAALTAEKEALQGEIMALRRIAIP